MNKQKHQPKKVKLTKAKIKKAMGIFNKGLAHYNAHEWDKALPHLNKFLDYEPDNFDVMIAIADCLVKLGVRDKAILMMEHILALGQPEGSACAVLARLAYDMGLYEIGVQLYKWTISFEPETPVHYVNLATCYNLLEQYDQSIDLLQSVLPVFPEEPALWNVLATSVQYRDSGEEARVFFDESLRIDPNYAPALNNIPMTCADIHEAIAISRRALDVNPEAVEPHMGLGHYLASIGEIKEAWEHYEYRWHKDRNVTGQSIIYLHKYTRWQGEDLAGKTLFVTAEQGLGDEIFFGAAMQHAYEVCEQMLIGVDYRLVSLMKKRFPKAIVGRWVNVQRAGYIYRGFPEIDAEIAEKDITVDYFVPIGSLAIPYWSDKENLPVYEDGYLKASDDRLSELKAKVDALGEGLKVGIAWRSGNMAASRKQHYMTLETMLPILKQKGVTFVKVQYGDVDDDIAKLEADHGIKIHSIDGLDYYNDIEGNFALIDALDLVISPGISPATYSMAVGTPLWVFVRWQLWWTFGDSEKVPLFPKTRPYIVGLYDDWSTIIEPMAEDFKKYIEENQ